VNSGVGRAFTWSGQALEVVALAVEGSDGKALASALLLSPSSTAGGGTAATGAAAAMSCAHVLDPTHPAVLAAAKLVTAGAGAGTSGSASSPGVPGKRSWGKLRAAVRAMGGLRSAGDGGLLAGVAVSDYLELVARDDVDRDAIRRNEFGWLLKSNVEDLEEDGTLPPRFEALKSSTTGAATATMAMATTMATAGTGKATAMVAAAAAQAERQVTLVDANKRDLLRRWLEARLVHDCAPQALALAEGLCEVVPPELVQMFDAAELQALLGGGEGGVDDSMLRAWRDSCEYDDSLRTHIPASCSSSSSASATAPLVREVGWFWEAVARMDPQGRADVWRYATGRSPPQDPSGFAAFSPKFNLLVLPQATETGTGASGAAKTDAALFFKAATCFGQLQFPGVFRPASGADGSSGGGGGVYFSSAAALAAQLGRSVAEGLAAAQGEPDGFEATQKRLQAAVGAAAGRLLGGAGGGGAALMIALRKEFPNAYMCGGCGFGPVDHTACADLRSHHGANHGGAKISNACPKCGWFSAQLSDWRPWDGNVHA